MVGNAAHALNERNVPDRISLTIAIFSAYDASRCLCHNLQHRSFVSWELHRERQLEEMMGGATKDRFPSDDAVVDRARDGWSLCLCMGFFVLHFDPVEINTGDNSA